MCCRKTVGYPEYEYEENGKTHRQRIYVSRAPEPTDVYWENLGVTPCTRFGYLILTYLATLLALAVVFAISYGVNRYKTDVENDYNRDKLAGNSQLSDLILVRGLSFLTSLIVVISNNILVILIRRFSISERHETYTKYNLSVAFKLTVATFLNSALIPIAVNYDQNDEWFSNGGLVVDIFYNFISIGFVTPFLYLLDVFFIIRVLKRCLASRKG